jgi:hypothetical protein
MGTSKSDIKAQASPKGGKRGCICKDGTYNSKCCDGSLMAQGIGTLTGQSTSIINGVES